MKQRLVLITEIIAPYRIPVLNALSRRPEIDLHVIFLAETDPTLRDWKVYRDEIQFSYEVLPSWRGRIGGHNLLLNSGLRRALRGAVPAAIICGGYNYFASWESLWWARNQHVRFLAWVESTSKDLRRGTAAVELLKSKFLHSCDGFIVPGKCSAEYIRSFGIEGERIFTAPNAVDNEFFEKHAEQYRRNLGDFRDSLHLPPRFFLFVGRLVREKGVFDLLRAYDRLEPRLRSEIGLVFVGDGIARAELARHASAISTGCIKFMGFAQREELAGFYLLAEALVFPTYTDTWGLVVNEAMACGLPIVCSTAAGCSADLVEDRWNGYLVPPGNAENLSSAMAKIAADSDLRTVMGSRSHERICQYSPERCAAGMADAVLSCGVTQYA